MSNEQVIAELRARRDELLRRAEVLTQAIEEIQQGRQTKAEPQAQPRSFEYANLSYAQAITKYITALQPEEVRPYSHLPRALISQGFGMDKKKKNLKQAIAYTFVHKADELGYEKKGPGLFVRKTPVADDDSVARPRFVRMEGRE